MTKLELLDISGTNISSGLEYLPGSVKYFDCSSMDEVVAIYDLFADEKGEAEEEWQYFHGEDYYCIKNFPQKLQVYKQSKLVAAKQTKIDNLEKESTERKSTTKK